MKNWQKIKKGEDVEITKILSSEAILKLPKMKRSEMAESIYKADPKSNLITCKSCKYIKTYCKKCITRWLKEEANES